jgi:hypothetical protein
MQQFYTYREKLTETISCSTENRKDEELKTITALSLLDYCIRCHFPHSSIRMLNPQTMFIPASITMKSIRK